MNSDDFQITKVPTIMVVKTDGIVEAYVGPDATAWVYSMVQQRHPPQAQTHYTPQKKPKAGILQTPVTSEQGEQIIDDDDDDEDGDDSELINADPQPTQKSITASKSSSVNMTEILDQAKQMQIERENMLTIDGQLSDPI